MKYKFEKHFCVLAEWAMNLGTILLKTIHKTEKMRKKWKWKPTEQVIPMRGEEL